MMKDEIKKKKLNYKKNPKKPESVELTCKTYDPDHEIR
jgi:hypothetical protein